MEPEEEKIVCPYGECDGSGEIEIMGDGEHFEWDVIGYKKCLCRMDE